MRKLSLTLAVVVLVAFAFTSCKKKYECCYYKDGTKLEDETFKCMTTEKASKKDIKDFEDKVNAGTGTSGYKYECN